MKKGFASLTIGSVNLSTQKEVIRFTYQKKKFRIFKILHAQGITLNTPC